MNIQLTLAGVATFIALCAVTILTLLEALNGTVITAP